MKVLITGGAGFIGSHTADLLLQKGYEVRILDSLEPPVHPQRKIPEYVTGDMEFIPGDVRNRDDVARALDGVGAVFHLAAYQDYLTDFSKFAFVNDGGTAMLYEVIVDKHLPIEKVVLASSQAVYGEGKYRCLNHGVQYPPPRPLAQLENRDWEIICPICREPMKPLESDETRVNCHNQYAVSKYCQELYALTLGRRHGIPTAVLRFSITQGPRQSFYNAYSGILRIFTTRLLNDLPPVIYEDGRQLRDYVNVRDAAQANLLALTSDKADFEVFNVGGSRAITVLEYANLLMSVTGKNIEPVLGGEFRFGDTRHVFSGISKIGQLGFKPRVPLEQTIREYVAWVRSQKDSPDCSAQAMDFMRKHGVVRSVKR